jgi:glycogen synthase
MVPVSVVPNCLDTERWGPLEQAQARELLGLPADAVVIPSRQDNLPNTGVEAHACGTQVVTFNTGGLPDMVEDHRTGYLVKSFVRRTWRREFGGCWERVYQRPSARGRASGPWNCFQIR